MNKTMLYISIFIVGFIGVSLLSFYIVIRPPKINVDRKPADFNLPAENVVITAKDGVKLSAWFIVSERRRNIKQSASIESQKPDPDGDKKRALVILHGYPAEKSDMLYIASALYPDFTLLLMDMRYFGESEGKYTTLGMKERSDLSSGIDFLESRGYESVGVFGFSLGGAVAFLTATEDERIDAIATYAAFSDLKTLGLETYSHLFILKKPLINLMLIWSRILFGEWATNISPENMAKNISIPVFVIHSKEDEQINFEHARRLKNALTENKKAEFYFLESGLHGELPLDFSVRLKDFFNKSLR